jgi:vitamin B12 transporter
MPHYQPGRRPKFRHASIRSAALVGLTLLGLSNPAPAQTSVPSTLIDPVVVTAARQPQALSDALPSTSVISRSDIENSQEQDVVTLLRRLAGVEIAQSGGLGAQASVFMRGSNSNQTLILIDGVRVNQLESGGALLQHLMLNDIDHIEVVRGNVSALYGSQAVGGVIQIFTRASAMAPGVAVDLQGGGDATGNLSVAAATLAGNEGARTRAAMSFSANTMGGFPAINPAVASETNPANDTYRNGALTAALSQQIGEQQVNLRVLDSYSRLEFDDPTNYSFVDPGYDGRLYGDLETTHMTSASLDAHLALGPGLTGVLRVGSQDDRTVDSSTFASSFLIGTTESRTNQYGMDISYALGASQKLNASVEHIDETGNSTAYAEEFTRRVDSLLAGYLGQFGPNELQAGVRTDHYSDFGSADSGLLAYGFRFAEHYKAIAQVSNAFDAPTFDDLFYPGASNPDLKPEKSDSFEAGLEYADSNLTGRVTAYRTSVHDLIEFNPVTFIPENVAHARLSGLEFSLTANWQGWQAYANLTLQRPIDSDTDQLLLRRATHNLNAGLGRHWGRWYFGGDVEAAGSRYDDDINTFARISLPGYSIANVVARYAYDPRTTLSLSLHNAFDRHYELVDGYNTPGRVLLAGVSMRF